MAKELRLEYDPVGDILYLDTASPVEHQIMIEVSPGVLLRKNTVTGAIEGIEVHGFQRRASDEAGLSVPVSIELQQLLRVAS